MKYVGLQAQVRKNNLRSTILLILFPTIVLGLTWLFFFILGNLESGDGRTADGTMSMSDINYLFIQTVPWVMGVCAIWFLIAYFANASMIQSATSAHSLNRTENKRVYNLVENLCMAHGMAMPKVNVIEDDSMNAYASGINKKSYAVTLSRGAIDRLNDEELEGVIAHELSHIRNRDVRLLIVSIIFVGIFAFLSNLMLRSALYGGLSRGGGKNKGNGAILIIVVLVLAALGYLISMLLRFAISRKREYMADAGAAQMTKKPHALASALRKISTDSRIEAVTRNDVAQLFIEHAAKGSGSSTPMAGLFATHPPIEKRIQVLEQF